VDLFCLWKKSKSGESMSHQRVNNDINGYLCILGVILILIATVGHCSEVPKLNRRDNVARFHENPFEYLFGEILAVHRIENDHEIYTQVHIKPMGSILEQVITFCGEPDQYDWQASVAVLTFERQARGELSMPCHVLQPDLSINFEMEKQ
jgi:hypothetical protein